MGDSDRPLDETRTTACGGSGESAPLPIQRLGDFEVLGELGRGGMGVVYEARQLSLKRRVALEALPPVPGMGKNAVERFEREAHAAAKLHHTDIVPVHAIGKEGGSHYYSVVLWRDGRLDDALREMEAALELESPVLGTYPYPWQQLARVHWEPGNPDEARRYYDRAAAIIDKYAPRQVGWNLTQDEIAALLGIER